MDAEPSLPAQYGRVVAEIPWLRANVEASADAVVHDGAATGELLTTPAGVASLVRPGLDLFPMPEAGDSAERYVAQLWWYSACGAWLRVTAAMILLEDAAPRPSWEGARFFVRDGFWPGFATGTVGDVPADDADAVRAHGRDVGRWLEPTIAALGEAFGVRPAPLWAILGDELAGAAVAIGNELMEPWRGVAVGTWLAEGCAGAAEEAGARMPAPRFADVTEDAVEDCDVAAALAGEEPDWDTTCALVRSSCCMIFHSPVADMCTSCPRRPREEREAGWMAATG
ncbi:(2Fe-2S)-binding protein [Corynebacterium sp. 335C]